MKRILALIIACALIFAGCSGGNRETDPTRPGETTLAPTIPSTETTIPEESTAPMQETEPAPTTESTETEPASTTEATETEPASEPQVEAPPETEAVFEPYLFSIADPETQIYAEPGFVHEITALVEEAGVYTIVEEATDRDGNLWGKLKSGLGWVCLTTPPLSPVSAQYAPKGFVADLEWHCGETDYVTDMVFIANEPITDVVFSLLDIFSDYKEDTILYTADAMASDQTLKASVVFWGDFTTYGLSFTDEDGYRRTYALMISGKDGSLICSEYSN